MLQAPVKGGQELIGGEPALARAHQQRQILGHLTRFHRFDAHRFKRVSKSGQRAVIVELGAVGQTAGPGKNRGDRVG